MNTRPTFEHVTDDGEIIDLAQDTRSPLQIARSELAAFKFATLETVRGDPRLSGAPCLAVISVYLQFVTIDERKLKPTAAFASNITLMARAAIKSKTTARAARRLLVEHGYLVRLGETKDGCEKYQVHNPHFERVNMHVIEVEEYLKQLEAARREDDRRKRKRIAPAVGTDIDPTQNESGIRNCTHVGTDIDPNYLGGNLSRVGSEEETPSDLGSTSQVYGQEDDPHLPYPIPRSEDEAAAMLEALREGSELSPAIMNFFRAAMMAGKLTPAMVEEQRRFVA